MHSKGFSGVSPPLKKYYETHSCNSVFYEKVNKSSVSLFGVHDTLHNIIFSASIMQCLLYETVLNRHCLVSSIN